MNFCQHNLSFALIKSRNPYILYCSLSLLLTFVIMITEDYGLLALVLCSTWFLYYRVHIKWPLHASRWTKRPSCYDGYAEYGSDQGISGQFLLLKHLNFPLFSSCSCSATLEELFFLLVWECC